MKKTFCLLSVYFLAVFAGNLAAQPFFQRFDSVDVKIGSSYITNPWAGGLNFVQTSEVDMNMDGIKDLFVFDRSGDKWRTFINNGATNTVDYKYNAYYESKFPDMHYWALLKDYNGDGKEDLFTYSKAGGGMDIYKNVSTIAGGLQFQLVSLQQKSIYNPTRFNTSPAAIPDGMVSNTWDGISGGAAAFASRAINVTNLNAAYWKLMSVSLNISHSNDNDVIVYLVNPCGDRLRLIRNAGGSGHSFIGTNFSPYSSNVIGSVGFNTAPFTGTYAPEAGTAAWTTFLACANPNGVWYLNVADQSGGNVGTIKDWSLTFYSPNYTPFTSLSPTNLYVSAVDIPSLTDIDNDGDLDVVTFAITGTYMEYHQNLSMDIYGTTDSLIFYAKNKCWGYAAEDALSNDYTLNDTCLGNVGNPGIVEHDENTKSTERHSGSCQLCIDLDNDGDKEFIVGDVSFPNLTMLTNGGTPYAAHFVAVDTAFPANNTSTIPVAQTLFPCAYYVDVNNDNLKDLIVSPNSPNYSENFNSEMYYKNTGTNNAPIFQYQQSNLLQDNMIEVGEGAYPVFFDYDNDGLKDLFVGNYGYYNALGFEHKIAQFKNIGTASIPKYELITRDYNNLSSLGITNMVPTFGDMDGDGDADMFIGAYDGRLHYFQNIAAIGSPANFVLTVANFKNSNNRTIDVGNYATPQIFDVDNDGKNDLVIGAENGKFAYYQHTGSATSTVPAMDSISHYFGKVKVNQPGYIYGWSQPFVFRQAGQTTILAGSELGYLRLYNHIDGNFSGVFTLVDSTYMGVREGERATVFGADVTNDGLLDFVVGNYSGGLSFFKGVSSISTSNEIAHSINWNLEAFPNPANTSITIRIVNDRISDYQIQLFNTIGQLLTTQHINTTEAIINTGNLKPGIYFIKVNELETNGQLKNSLVKRVVIQH